MTKFTSHQDLQLFLNTQPPIQWVPEALPWG